MTAEPSASELLARLDGEATAGPWEAKIERYDEPGKDWHGEEWTRGIRLGSNDFIETDGGHYGPGPANARLIAVLRNALPEIAAVVKAAEGEHGERPEYPDSCPTCGALAALRDKLSEAGK